MAFDPTSAAPVDDSAPAGFDPSSAKLHEPGKPAATAVDDGDTLQFGPLDTHIPINSNVQNALAGAGKAFSDNGAGVRQIALHIGNHLGLIPDDDVRKNQEDIDETKNRDKPLMDTKAGMAGNIVGQAAPMLAAPGVGMWGSAAEGALIGAAQPVATGESRAQNSGIGAAGGAAGAGVGKLFGAIGGFGIPMERQAAVKVLQSEGIPTSVAQKTAAKGAQTIERSSAMISDAQKEFEAKQAPAFNRAVLRRIGVNDPNVTAATPEVLGPAQKKITNVMDEVAARTKPKVDDKLLNDMVGIEQDAARQLPEHDIGPISQNLKDIITNGAKNDGYMDGTFVQKLNSNLGALSRNPATAPIAHDLQEAVHDAIQRYASPEDVAALKTARAQYRAMKQIEPAVDASTGNISVPKLMNSLNSKTYGSRNQTLYGRGDQSLVNLARAAKTVIPDTLGNSGTAERMIGPLTAMEVAQSGKIPTAATQAAMAVGTGALAGRAMRNQGVIGHVLASGVPGLRTIAKGTKRALPSSGYGATESEKKTEPAIDVGDEPVARASGGRVDVGSLADKLISRWKTAKRETDNSTKPLLGASDSAIAKALSIAQESI